MPGCDRAAASLLAAALLACGAAGPPPHTAPGDGGATGPSGPRIIAMSPVPDSRGHPPDAKITLRFDRAMDPVSTQQAWSAPRLGPVSFQWNADRTEMTVVPDQPMPYAQGEAAELPAERIEIRLTDVALDATGRRSVPFVAGFFTARLLTRECLSDFALDGYVRADGSVDSCQYLTADGAICVGQSMSAGLPYAGLVTFDLSTLPADLLQITSASLRVYQYRADGEPYVVLGALRLEHVRYESKEAAFAVGALRGLGVLSLDATVGWKEPEDRAGLLSAVTEDWAERTRRGARSQYRLRFPLPTSVDGGAHVAKLFGRGVALAADPERRDKYPRLRVTFWVP